MPSVGGAKSRMNHSRYPRRVADYLLAQYGARGLCVYDEVSVGTSMIGKARRVDLLVHVPQTSRALAIECKWQDTSGTADEKIPYALQDLEQMRMPALLVYAGSGFSPGVLHLLQSSAFAVYCLPDDSLEPTRRRRDDPVDVGTWQLDHALAQLFSWWDVLVAHKQPLALGVERGP